MRHPTILYYKMDTTNRNSLAITQILKTTTAKKIVLEWQLTTGWMLEYSFTRQGNILQEHLKLVCIIYTAE